MKPTVGRRSYVTEGCDITARVTIGNYTAVGPYVQMHARTQHPCVGDPNLACAGNGQAIPGYPKPHSVDRIAIGHDVWIGRNAVLLGGCSVGHGAVVGAYAVVAGDVPPYAVVVGNPARVIRYRFDAETVAKLLDLEWWHWPDAVIAERAADLRDVPRLVATYAYEDYRNGSGS